VGIGLAALYDRYVHFCHISRRQEIEPIAAAKGRGLPVTCEVAPHHLFLTESDAARLGPLGHMRPLLGTQDDVEALWSHIDNTIDCIATDHAPHTLAEKQTNTPPPGVPGLETSLPLMLTAVQDGRLTMARLIELMATNPQRLFHLPPQPEAKVQVEMRPTTISNDGLQTKCGWTPFAGMQVAGRVRQVTVAGRSVYEEGQVLAAPGSGRLIQG
jgi:carbamoyl-phosphate synthase/aspartate carbamoyltransferase/dihydroorotase